jgi:hypothetical protein
MRFMMLVRADKHTEAGVLPSKELVDAMGRFNEEMVKAGILLAAEGIQPSSKGARVAFSRRAPALREGPFPHHELIAGLWMIQVPSKQHAIEWAKRVPFKNGEVVEVRQVFEACDFPPDIVSPEEAARQDAMRRKVRRKRTP